VPSKPIPTSITLEKTNMLTVSRDYQRGGEHFAIPTQGEVEGRLLVSEVVAVTCLRELLKKEHAPVLARVRRHVMRDVKRRCQSMKLCAEDQKAVEDYALQVLNGANEEARSS